MNRVIKFKAKRRENGEWVKGSLMKTPFGTFIEWYEDSICNQREVDPNTVCQFTGMKDANGAELWENDIITAKSILDTEIEGKIMYFNACFFLGNIDEQGRKRAIRELWKYVDICRKGSALDKEDNHE